MSLRCCSVLRVEPLHSVRDRNAVSEPFGISARNQPSRAIDSVLTPLWKGRPNVRPVNGCELRRNTGCFSSLSEMFSMSPLGLVESSAGRLGGKSVSSADSRIGSVRVLTALSRSRRGDQSIRRPRSSRIDSSAVGCVSLRTKWVGSTMCVGSRSVARGANEFLRELGGEMNT